MSQKVSTFARVSAHGYDYVFILVVCNDYYWPVRDALARQADAFGQDLGLRGLFVEAFQRRQFDAAHEVLAKPWPTDIKSKMEADPEPILLIIQHDFATFDPNQHSWAVIWLSDFENQPYDITPVLAKLASITRSGEDLLAYLQGIAAKSARATAASQFTKYIALKPGIFGCAIDVGAILTHLAGTAQGTHRAEVRRTRGR